MMLKFIAHDTINDIALIKTSFCYYVRYGLQQTRFDFGKLPYAMKDFYDCQRHAVECEGYLYNKEESNNV